MDTLPEELVAHILSYIHDHDAADPLHPHPDNKTLHAICLTSRRFSRIGIPYLYHSIHSTSGTMGVALRRVLADDTTGNLRRAVRELTVQHTTQGCITVSNKYAFDDEGYGRTYDLCQRTFFHTARLLPCLETLDLSRLPLAEEVGGTWLSALNAKCGMDRRGWYRQTGFEHVKRMALHLGSLGVEEIWTVFRLPELRELEVDVRTKAREVEWLRRYGNSERWQTGMSGVEVLRVVGLSYACGRASTIEYMSRACVALKSLFVAIGDIDVVEKIPKMFEAHVSCGVLKSVQIAVVGLWHYDVDLVSVEKESDLQRLGIELGNLMMHATGSYDESRDEVFESEHMRIAEIREQSSSEKRNYDPRRARRP